MRSPGGPDAAGFWVRTLALALDLALLWLVHRTLWLVAHAGPERGFGARAMAAVGALGFWLTYRTVLHAHGGQTLGKLLVGIRVVPEGPGASTIGGGTAWLRCLAEACSALPVGSGYLMAAWRADKRSLHDLAAGTRVVWARAAAELTVRGPAVGAVDARPIGPESGRPIEDGATGGRSGFD